ncbi:MAG: VWA domain-containing protein [Planctomycetota bacterium]|nr:VWA domain-containing protein [Planctomycetota bacterium]
MTDSIDFVKYELKRAIGALAEDKEFHVLFYSSGPPVEMPPRQPVKAAAANKEKAYEFIDGVIAQGETDPSRALKRAFDCRPDEIYLLTDGEFDAKTVDYIKDLNNQADRVLGEKKVRVHTFGFLYKTGEAILKKIAEQNDGQYKFVSEKDLADLTKPADTKGR